MERVQTLTVASAAAGVSGRERASGIPAGPGMLIRTIAVRSKTTAAWGQVPLASRKHILTMCDQIIPAVMSSMRPVVRREEAQEHLNVLRARIARRLDTMRVPKGPKRTGGYHRMFAVNRKLEALLMTSYAQLGMLEKELEEQTRALEEEAEKVTEAEDNLHDARLRGRQPQAPLHPALSKPASRQLKLDDATISAALQLSATPAAGQLDGDVAGALERVLPVMAEVERRAEAHAPWLRSTTRAYDMLDVAMRRLEPLADAASAPR